MNTPTETKKENSRTTFSLIAAFMVVLIIVSVVAYKAGIDPKQIKADVAAFSENLTKRYAARGVDVQLTYSDVEVKGGIFEKSILLKDARFSVKSAKIDYALSTIEAKAIPHDSHYDELSIEFAAPLLVEKNGGAMKAVYSSETPLKIDVTLNEQGTREYVMPLPLAAKVEIETGGEKKIYDISNDEQSFVSGTFDDSAKHPYSFSLVIGELNVKGNSSDATAQSVSLTSSMDEQDNSLEINIAQFKTNKLPESLGGLDFTLSQKSKKEDASNLTIMNLDEMLLTGEGFNVSVKGKLQAKTEDLLPQVDVNVQLNGASKLFAALGETDHFSPNHKTIVIKALKLISPEWNEFSLSPLNFTVKRDENSPFVIGAAKADELLALVLQQYLQLEQTPQPSQPVSEVPPAPSDVEKTVEEDTKAGSTQKDEPATEIAPKLEEKKEEVPAEKLAE